MNNMNNQEINIAIAEACGWKPVFLMRDMAGNPFPGQDITPDYCNDLNAMHEAETTLADEQHKHFRNNLLFPNCYKMEKAQAERQVVSATASQRAEAFLRVFDKWKEATK